MNTSNLKDFSLHLEQNKKATKRGISRRKKLYGVGVLDVAYSPSGIIDGVVAMCPAYAAWRGMLKRAYSGAHPSYVGVTVVSEWHSFSTFRAWWLDNVIDGFQLDKDILEYPNKIYGPDTCVYIPAHINTFLSDSRKIRGEYPIGVTFDTFTNNFQASCKNGEGKKLNLGRYSTPDEAHKAWKRYKTEKLQDMRKELDSIHPKLYPQMLKIINSHCKDS